MSNPHTGTVRVTLGDEEVAIRLSMNAAADIEDVAGKSIEKFMAEFEAAPVKNMRILFWACIADARPGFSLRDAGAWLEQADPHVSNDLAKDLIRNSGLFDLAEDDSGNPPAPKDGAEFKTKQVTG